MKPEDVKVGMTFYYNLSPFRTWTVIKIYLADNYPYADIVDEKGWIITGHPLKSSMLINKIHYTPIEIKETEIPEIEWI